MPGLALSISVKSSVPPNIRTGVTLALVGDLLCGVTEPVGEVCVCVCVCVCVVAMSLNCPTRNFFTNLF